MTTSANPADERTPLLRSPEGPDVPQEEEDVVVVAVVVGPRQGLYDFLEAKTPSGRIYEKFIMILIVVNVLAFVLGTLFLEEYNRDSAWAKRGVICGNACDAIWFGNFADNSLQFLNIGSTSVLEIGTVLVFTVEYILRLYTADLLNPQKYGGWKRIYWIPTFFSCVDLASTLPFYVDAFVLRQTDIAASGFLRMFRLLRMMRVEGRYDTALTMVDDVYELQKGILLTAVFVGVTVWMAVSSLYYLVERRNFDMIYCESCGDDHELDAKNDCVMDSWGSVDCQNCNGCYNLYESIPMASYYALLNLFGEYPHVDAHSYGGKIVGTCTAIVAVAVFALPVGIIGNGFEQVIQKRRKAMNLVGAKGPIREESSLTENFRAPIESTWSGYLYNLLHAQTTRGAFAVEVLINGLVLGTVLSFMLDTLVELPPWLHVFLKTFELVAVTVFTIEYALRVYSIVEDPKYSSRFLYIKTFLTVVDLLSFLPYWIELGVTGGKDFLSPTSDSNNTLSNVVRTLRLIRILRFERYTHAFLTFDDVFMRNLDILAVTAFTALLFWIFFAAFLYLSERNSLDDEMASNYNNMPNSMWITLLNLSGESPLSEYSFLGKVVTAILGLFATGVFGIPIGVLGTGFEEIVEEENEDNNEELERTAAEESDCNRNLVGSISEQTAFKFVNGLGSTPAMWFELSIYALIGLSVTVGVWQTVEGQENDFHEVEWLAVIVFTFEYLVRLYGIGADPEFSSGGSAILCRLRFIGSFYSIIDLLAIVPFYIAVALPNSFLNQYDEYLRMARLFRLVKLDKYIPSITLIDNVIRLKYNTLRVAFYAAVTLWMLFAALIFICEHKDQSNGIDPVPLYGCDEDCTMMDRFQNFFDSMVYTGIHLTGDYPITTYTWPARFVNFFMVIAAVGVVSIPSSVIASGFVEIVQSKNRKRRGQDIVPAKLAGDDWYEISYRALEAVEPPPSRFGPTIDRWQNAVNEFLNGKKLENGHHYWSRPAFAARIFIFFIILANVAAVLSESVPSIDKAVGNKKGNFFDTFEAFSVLFCFFPEYCARLFCAPKNRESLYSTFTYATTFFGIVDFLSTAPWFIEQGLTATGYLDAGGDNARIFRIFRIFRILQLEDFVVAFSKLDNVFRASKDVLKATGLMAIIVWVGCGALFFIFEENNPNWRSCDSSIPPTSDDPKNPGCFDFASTSECNKFYPGMCEQKVFTDMPNALYLTAVFLGGEWGVVDFTWPGRFICLFLCVVGIGLYSIPIGTLFDSFGAVLGLGGDDEEEEEEENEKEE